MKQLSILLLACMTSISFGQTKTFNGEYPMSGIFKWVKGKAKYSYTEADSIKIKDGTFTFSANMKGTEFGQSSRARFSLLVSGFYKNNLKDGVWSHKTTIENMEMAGNTVLLANVSHDNGIPNGVWTLQGTENGTGVVMQDISLNFVSGVVVAYSYKEINPDKEIRGSCDENGFLHGKQIKVIYDEETTTEYTHGKEMLSITRNTKTGKILNRTTILSPTDSAQIDVILAIAKTNPDALLDQSFRVDDFRYRYLYDYFGKSFEAALQGNDFNGDTMYNINNIYHFDWRGFRCYALFEQYTRDEMAKKKNR